jgi:phosphatidylglycerophosphatase A
LLREDTTISADTAVRPNVRFVLRHPAHLVALGGGLGLIPIAPGTFGTLLAFPIFWFAGPRLDDVVYLAAVAVLFAVGVWACEVTGRDLNAPDHGSMVWDETVAFLLVLWFTLGLNGYWQLAAFVLFRAFDIAKPPPIRYYERRFKGGLGVMIDDIAAAAYTVIVLAVARRLLPHFV